MTLQDRLDGEAREVAEWLQAHASDFPPLRVLRVSSAVITEDDGDPAIKLTAVLEDPADPRAGWPTEAFFDLVDAVNERSRDSVSGMFVFVRPLAASDQAA